MENGKITLTFLVLTIMSIIGCATISNLHLMGWSIPDWVGYSSLLIFALLLLGFFTSLLIEICRAWNEISIPNTHTTAYILRYNRNRRCGFTPFLALRFLINFYLFFCYFFTWLLNKKELYYRCEIEKVEIKKIKKRGTKC